MRFVFGIMIFGELAEAVKSIVQMAGLKLKRFWSAERDMAGLYAGVFFHAFFGGTGMVAMPFIIKRLSGSDTDVGLCMGLCFAGYAAGLVVCLLGRAVLDYFNIKHTVQFGAGAITLVAAAAYLTVVAAERGYDTDSAILVLIALSIMQGFLSSLFWPRVVGWLSTGHEGRQLNRKLGIFNVSWSLGGMIGPCVGGYLVEINSTLPLMICTMMVMLSFVAVGFARKPQMRMDIVGNCRTKTEADGTEILCWRFMWMARIALMTVFVCLGLMRTQLALLFKFNLGFSESNFGMVIMIMSATIFVVFFTMGRTHNWHYVLSIFLGAQALMLCGMLLILNGVSLWVFFLSAAVVGVGNAYLYSSHLYYGISGAQNRSSRMAIHEITLSIGLFIGSIVGGYLGDNFNRYVPYWFGFGVVVIGLLAQLAVWFSRRADSSG